MGSRRWGGFTLLEVLVAAAIFCTAILAMVGMWSVQARAVDMARDVLAATELAEQELEGTLALGYAQAASRRGEQVVTLQVDGRPVARTLAYVVTVSQLRAGLKDVVVRVTWRGGEGGHEVVVETALAS